MKRINLKAYGLEFLSIFIAVALAFSLNNWNDNRREKKAADKILIEIHNGLNQDFKDLEENRNGHLRGIAACVYWRKAIHGDSISQDSVVRMYSDLTRDFLAIQNVSGYETLKSRGLELLRDDSLRHQIISLYEYDYAIMRKLEESYDEHQFFKHYFHDINTALSPFFIYSDKGQLKGIQTPLTLNKQEYQLLMSYFDKIEMNRKFALPFYDNVLNKLDQTTNRIELMLDENSTLKSIHDA